MLQSAQSYRTMPDGATLQEYLDQLGVGKLTPVDQMALDNKLHEVLAQPQREGVIAWIRFCSDGTYEGPISDQRMDDIRRQSGAWTPLYAEKKEMVSADIPKAMLALEDSWNSMAKQNRDAAYFGAAGAYEDCVYDLEMLRCSISSTLVGTSPVANTQQPASAAVGAILDQMELVIQHVPSAERTTLNKMLGDLRNQQADKAGGDRG